MDYVIWDSVYNEGDCVCESLEGFNDSYKLSEGMPVSAYFHGDAFFQMSSDFPKDVRVTDNIFNRGGFMLISGVVKKIIETHCKENNVEFLSVKIKNHKKKFLDYPYYIVNPLDFADAIDMEKSDVRWNNIDPESISSINSLILNENLIDPNYNIFRLEHFPNRILIRRNIVDKLNEMNLTGIRIIEVKNFHGF